MTRRSFTRWLRAVPVSRAMPKSHPVLVASMLEMPWKRHVGQRFLVLWLKWTRATPKMGSIGDGKYWRIHLEKGEKLGVNGWAISTNLSSGAALWIEIQGAGNPNWVLVNSVAAYGFAKYGSGAFVAPAAGYYTLRAVCKTTRLCKFAIHLTVNGRQCPPPYACPCSLDKGTPLTGTLPVELWNGRERAEFGTDLDVANPIGPDVAFGRLWTEALALQKVASPGLSRGWTHSYDIRLNAFGNRDLQVQFPNGG